MEAATIEKSVTKYKRIMWWTGWIISGICVLFILFDGSMKAIGAASSVEATKGLGLPGIIVQPMGLLMLLFVILYCIPKTAVIGVLFYTAHLGGAVAIFIQQFHDDHFYLFPFNFCLLMWCGLILRDARIRGLIFGLRSV